MITFTLDTKDFQVYVDKLTKYDKSDIHKGFGFIIENKVVENIEAMGLVDSGDFKNSVNHYDYDNKRVIVQDGVYYGKYLEFGTRPHGPKTAKALHWITKGGKHVFAKRVKGIREYAPFRKGLINSIKAMEDYALKKILAVAK